MKLWLLLQFYPWIWTRICFCCSAGGRIVDLLNKNLSPQSEFFWMNFYSDLQMQQNSNCHWNSNCLSNLHLLLVKWTICDTIICKQNSKCKQTADKCKQQLTNVNKQLINTNKQLININRQLLKLNKQLLKSKQTADKK